MAKARSRENPYYCITVKCFVLFAVMHCELKRAHLLGSAVSWQVFLRKICCLGRKQFAVRGDQKRKGVKWVGNNRQIYLGGMLGLWSKIIVVCRFP